MAFISLAIAIAQIALAAVILWFVCEWLPMPENAKRICQLLIALIAILSAINIIMAGTAPPPRSLPPITTPDIMKPERK